MRQVHQVLVHQAGPLLFQALRFGRTFLLALVVAIFALSPAIADSGGEGAALERMPLPDLRVDNLHVEKGGVAEKENLAKSFGKSAEDISPKPLDDDTVGERSTEKLDGREATGLNRAVYTPQTLRIALQDYREKRVKQAISGFALAEQNNSFIARFLLAHIYRTGKGGLVDHRRAYDYYQQIADEFAGEDFQYFLNAPYVAHAFVQLARYMEGGVEDLDIKSNPLLAQILFEKAAYFGDVEGQYQLGRFLIETGKPHNVKLGQRWLTKAAKKNHAKAQAYLGALYWQGDLIVREQAKALAWIEFARRNASGYVKNQVERLYQAVRFDMTLQQKRKANIYIAQLKTLHNVLWRQIPVRVEEADEVLLDGIILAEPPQGLDRRLLEARGPVNQHPQPKQEWDAGPDGDYSSSLPDRPSFGYRMFEYGNAGGR